MLDNKIRNKDINLSYPTANIKELNNLQEKIDFIKQGGEIFVSL